MHNRCSSGCLHKPYGKHYGLLWKDGTASVLPALGDNRTLAYAINNKGQIVGTSYDPSGNTHAVLWENGEIIPGWPGYSQRFQLPKLGIQSAKQTHSYFVTDW